MRALLQNLGLQSIYCRTLYHAFCLYKFHANLGLGLPCQIEVLSLRQSLAGPMTCTLYDS